MRSSEPSSSSAAALLGPELPPQLVRHDDLVALPARGAEQLAERRPPSSPSDRSLPVSSSYRASSRKSIPASRAATITAIPVSRGIRSNVRHEPSESAETRCPTSRVRGAPCLSSRGARAAAGRRAARAAAPHARPTHAARARSGKGGRGRRPGTDRDGRASSRACARARRTSRRRRSSSGTSVFFIQKPPFVSRGKTKSIPSAGASCGP